MGSTSEFSGKVVLITGGSSGIGLETGKLLSQLGASVWLAARNKDRVEQALREVESARCSPGQSPGGVTADVTDIDQSTAAVARVTEACGSPDILINSAGDVYPALFHETEMQVMRNLMEVNYFGTVNMTRACLPSMMARRQGYIVNISSVYGFMGGYAYSGYCASKFAQVGFAQSLDYEVRERGVKVSVITPGGVNTEFAYGTGRTPGAPRLKHYLEPEDVAEAVIFALTQPPKSRVFLIGMRPMYEPL